jgi:transposase
MATERLPMRKIREVLRMRWHLELTVREISRGLGISVGVVQKIAARAKTAGLTWEMAEGLTEDALEERLYGRPAPPGNERARPDPAYMHRELRRAGVTLELLHLEYLEEHPDGLRYTAFCDTYRRWLSTAGLVMRQVHKAGEKTFVDYSGKKPAYVAPQTGELIEVEFFVSVLGASNYTYAEATATQQVADFIGSHVRAYAYFGGVTEITVPDQLKSGVTTSDRYEPGVQRTYGEMAKHYGTAIVPARPRKPRDKAKVEVGVQIAQRWILARLRNETFFSLAALNARIAELRDELNARPMKKLGGATRRDLFERYDRPALRALPSAPYELTAWEQVRVNLDYHVEIDKHWYSVPYQVLTVGKREPLWACSTESMVQIFHRGQRVAAHVRSRVAHKHTTDPSHMPPAHRAYSAGVDGVIAWAAAFGPMTEAMVRRLIDANPVREQGWRSARGLRRVAEKYGPERTERACARALFFGARSYKPVEKILSLGREQLPLPSEEHAEALVIDHENVRGADYFN